MTHMFDTEIAEQLSVNAAIIFQHIAFWCIHSEANGTNYHDGEYWTYSSVNAFCTVFPYLSAKQINVAIKKLLDAELIIKGNYNKSAYDRTIWYAVTKKGKSIYRKGKMENPKRENGLPEKGEPIPDIVPDNSLDNSIKRGGAMRFCPPTLEEVKAYASERGYAGFNAERFLAYYESNGWKVGRNPMKDWKAAVRNWAARDKEQPTGRSTEWHNPALDYAQRDYTGTKPKPKSRVLNMETGEWEDEP